MSFSILLPQVQRPSRNPPAEFACRVTCRILQPCPARGSSPSLRMCRTSARSARAAAAQHPMGNRVGAIWIGRWAVEEHAGGRRFDQPPERCPGCRENAPPSIEHRKESRKALRSSVSSIRKSVDGIIRSSRGVIPRANAGNNNEILRILSVDAGRVVTSESLLRQARDAGEPTDTERVRTFVKQLRAKLGDDAKRPAGSSTSAASATAWQGPARSEGCSRVAGAARFTLRCSVLPRHEGSQKHVVYQRVKRTFRLLLTPRKTPGTQAPRPRRSATAGARSG